MDAAIGFYRDALGLDLLNDVASDGHRWVTVGKPGQPGVALVLSDPGAGRSPDDGEALRRLVAKGSGPGPYVFFADDLDTAFERGRRAVRRCCGSPWTNPGAPGTAPSGIRQATTSGSTRRGKLPSSRPISRHAGDRERLPA